MRVIDLAMLELVNSHSIKERVGFALKIKTKAKRHMADEGVVLFSGGAYINGSPTNSMRMIDGIGIEIGMTQQLKTNHIPNSYN